MNHGRMVDSGIRSSLGRLGPRSGDVYKSGEGESRAEVEVERSG